MIVLTSRRIRALARRFDRDEAGSPWTHGERELKACLARRRARGVLHLTRRELRWIGEWKSSRIRAQIARNTEAGVRGATAAAFLARSDAARLTVLLGLRGVGVAVASVILHFGDPARYPIYDVRVRAALRRMGVRRRFPPTAAGWAEYAAVLRALAARHRVSLRTLDKALWRLGGR
jgi:3-methyladenine DNA glycosylase/8-oxoguanine DNA glycosylase